MKFSEIASRLTGNSTPFSGGRGSLPVIASLEDRRVLHVPEEMELAAHCVHPAIEVRHCLSDELG
jgi:hypothetical protein